MANDVSELARRFVAERAKYRCEYCLIHESDTYTPHQIDHIISRKHGGQSNYDNLAYCCLRCNAWKGSDVGSINPHTGHFVSLFNPRQQDWGDHFELRGVLIAPLTPQGEATTRLLKLNLDKRIVERQFLTSAGRYPL